MATMHGTLGYTFSEMVRDTIEAHGFAWAWDYYVVRRGLSAWEFAIFAGCDYDSVTA